MEGSLFCFRTMTIDIDIWTEVTWQRDNAWNSFCANVTILEARNVSSQMIENVVKCWLVVQQRWKCVIPASLHLSKWTALLISTVVMFQTQNRETINSTWKVAESFKITMTASVTKPCLTTQHQTCKTKTKSRACKTKPDVLVSNRSCLWPTVSDHITRLGSCIWPIMQPR